MGNKIIAASLLLISSLCSFSEEVTHTDDEIKAQFVKAGRFYHAEDMDSKYSKRRLQVMRLSMERCLNSFHTNYITNAINELVAYPESELPD